MPPSDADFLLSCLMHSGGPNQIASVNWTAVAQEAGYLNPGSAKNRFAALKKKYWETRNGTSGGGEVDRPVTPKRKRAKKVKNHEEEEEEEADTKRIKSEDGC